MAVETYSILGTASPTNYLTHYNSSYKWESRCESIASWESHRSKSRAVFEPRRVWARDEVPADVELLILPHSSCPDWSPWTKSAGIWTCILYLSLESEEDAFMWLAIYLLATIFKAGEGGGLRILWVGGNSTGDKIKEFFKLSNEWTSCITWGRARCSNLLISSSFTNYSLLLLLVFEQVPQALLKRVEVIIISWTSGIVLSLGPSCIVYYYASLCVFIFFGSSLSLLQNVKPAF